MRASEPGPWGALERVWARRSPRLCGRRLTPAKRSRRSTDTKRGALARSLIHEHPDPSPAMEFGTHADTYAQSHEISVTATHNMQVLKNPAFEATTTRNIDPFPCARQTCASKASFPKPTQAFVTTDGLLGSNATPNHTYNTRPACSTDATEDDNGHLCLSR